MDMSLRIVAPMPAYLDSYVKALRRGWSPDNVRGPEIIREQLERIAKDADGFLATQEDREATAGPVQLPDGSLVPRLPGFHRWLWDGEFCGTISIRWQPGTEDLPPHCLGLIALATSGTRSFHGNNAAATPRRRSPSYCRKRAR